LISSRRTICWLLALCVSGWGCYVLAKPIKVPKRGPDITAPLVLEWVVDPDGETVRITFNESVTGGTGFTYSMSGGAATLTYASGSGSGVFIYTSSRVINDGETGTGAYTDGNVEDDAPATNNLANFTGFTIDNQSVQIAGDDGAPIAPEEYVVPAIAANLATLESGATVITPASSAELTTLTTGGTVDGTTLAVAEAAGPVVIKLDNAVTYEGKFTFPALSNANWTYVVTDNFDSIPVAGNRVTSADSADLAAVNVINASPMRGAIFFAPNACKYRLVGIKSTFPDVAAATFGAITSGYTTVAGTAGIADTADLPTDIIIDRCWVYGRDVTGRPDAYGILLNGNGMAVIDSTIEKISATNGTGISDPMGIFTWNGGSRYLIENCYIEASGEGMLIGTDPVNTNEIPSDIVIKENHFFKPLYAKTDHGTYDGYNRIEKNHLEFKNAEKVIIRHNRFENLWNDFQRSSLVLTVRNQGHTGGDFPASVVQDVLIDENYFVDVCQVLQLTTTDNLRASDVSRRITFQHNLARGIGFGHDPASSGLTGGKALALSAPFTALIAEDWRFVHNTLVRHASDGGRGYQYGMAFFDLNGAGIFVNDLVFRDNLIACAPFSGTSRGLSGLTYAEGTATLNGRATVWQCEKNVFFDGVGSPTYPATNYTGSTITAASVVFENWAVSASGDYRLAAGSPYNNLATDGTDIGCDVVEVLAETADVVTGQRVP
jgi:hypothetical protein